MGENVITSLFNRVVLDVIVGFIVLLLVQLSALIFDANPEKALMASSLSKFSAVVLVIMGYLLGTTIDKMAYLVFDRSLFAKEFGERRASFQIPVEIVEEVKSVLPKASTLPTSDRSRIDDSSADWITALFYVEAPEDSLAKRRDLVANFQFISNMLAVISLAACVVPAFLIFKEHRLLWGLAAVVLLAGCALAFWAFSIAALRRINTFENLVVFGLLLRRHVELDIGDGHPIPRQPTREVSGSRRSQKR